VERDTIISHFRHIHLSGEMKEAVFTSCLDCLAINYTETILLEAQGLSGVDAMPEPVGVVELAMVIKALERMAPHETNITIDFDPSNNQFSFGTENHGRVCFATSPPRLITTRVRTEMVSTFVSQLLEGDRAPISSTFSELIRNGTAIIGANAITLSVRDNGTQVRVGTPERGDYCEFLFPALRSSEPYELRLEADDLLPVLKETQDYTRADLLANGPAGLVGVQEGCYTYVISALADDGQHCVDLVPEPLAEEGSGS
jgi:hypothetical protein